MVAEVSRAEVWRRRRRRRRRRKIRLSLKAQTKIPAGECVKWKDSIKIKMCLNEIWWEDVNSFMSLKM
jgi:hypothetical protein